MKDDTILAKIEPNELIQANRRLYAEGWTDGLPVVPPTEDVVEWMLSGTDRDRTEVIATLAPANGEASVEAIAVNAVMAGCLPEYLPVVITAVQCLGEEKINLNACQTTTEPLSSLVIVNGPVAKELNVNCGFSVFGSGWQANSTIGRAVRLCLRNIGGAIPGEADRATMGHPGKYTFCIAENEADSPWEPLHVERGLPRESSAVTVFWAEAPHNINDNRNKEPHAIMTGAASVMSQLGSNQLYRAGEAMIVLCPEHAATCAQHGWTKNDARLALFDKARKPLARVREGGAFGVSDLPRWVDDRWDDALVPIVHDPRDLVVIVAGGPGRQSMALLTAGASWSVTKPITLKDGTFVRSIRDIGIAEVSTFRK
jgi:hypothetical protein